MFAKGVIAYLESTGTTVFNQTLKIHDIKSRVPKDDVEREKRTEGEKDEKKSAEKFRIQKKWT